MAVISASRKGKPSGHRAVTDFELDGNVSQLSNTALWPQVAPLGPFFLPPVGFYRRRIYFRWSLEPSPRRSGSAVQTDQIFVQEVVRH